MADDADRAQQDSDIYASAMKTKYELPNGKAGKCVDCDRHSPRLIDKRCATCRDEIAELERRKAGR